MAGLYSYYIAPIVLTPAQVNTPQLVNTGNRLGGWLLIQNNSPYKIQVQLPGSAVILPLDPQTVDKLKVNAGDQQIYILPLALLPSAAPSSQVDIQVYPGDENEPPGTYPMALPRQTAPTSAAGTTGYTAFASLLSASVVQNTLVVFNPANSGVRFVIYEATVSFSAAANPQGRFGFQNSDPGIATGPGTLLPNLPGSPNSSGVVEATNGSTLVAANYWEFAAMVINQPKNFTPFPDQKTIAPGWAVILQGVDSANGSSANLTLKYTQQ